MRRIVPASRRLTFYERCADAKVGIVCRERNARHADFGPVKHSKFNARLLVPDESGCSFEGCRRIAKANALRIAKHQVVEFGGMDAAAEVCRHNLKIFTVTDQGRRISHAIEPDARGCGGLDFGALRFSY